MEERRVAGLEPSLALEVANPIGHLGPGLARFMVDQAADVIELEGIARRSDESRGEALVADDHATGGTRLFSETHGRGPAVVDRLATGEQASSDEPAPAVDQFHDTPRPR